jgi:hypothetical protein
VEAEDDEETVPVPVAPPGAALVAGAVPVVALELTVPVPVEVLVPLVVGEALGTGVKVCCGVVLGAAWPICV